MDKEYLEKKMANEKVFHDKKFSSQHERKSYYDAGFRSIVFQNFMESIGDIEGKKVLEYGCGNGWFTKKLAENGAEVWAFDISDEAIKRTYEFMTRLKLENKLHLSQMSAEKLTYDSEMFDIAVGNAILHHVDLAASLKELNRVLKDGGKAFFTEPLGHNPILNIYRLLTPQLRSKDEKPLSFKQYDMIHDIFPKFKHHEYYLTAILAVLWHYVGFDNIMLKSRDWLYRLDKIILKIFPFLKKYCWYSILEIEK